MTLIVYCANGTVTWVARLTQPKTWTFVCLNDQTRFSIVVDQASDVEKIHTGIVAHSVSLRGAFQRAERWFDL